MVVAATSLFRERGYDGTGLREIVERAGAARGAIYHHFPAGKQEIGLAVVDRVGGRLVAVVEEVCATATPREAVETLMAFVAEVLVDDGSPGRSGCPVAAVALAADDESGELRRSADAVFARIRTAVAGCLVRDGVRADAAAHFAATALAAAEGVVILARAAGEPALVDSVRSSLGWSLDHLPREQ